MTLGRVLMVVALSIGLSVSAPGARVSAHPGGLDSNGCHTCRTNCTEKYGIPYGDYHCYQGDGGGGGTDTTEPPPTAPPATQAPEPAPPSDTTSPPSTSPPASQSTTPTTQAEPPDPPHDVAVEVDSTTVIVTFTAEEGATVEIVHGDGTLLERVDATGEEQTAAFDLEEGEHKLTRSWRRTRPGTNRRGSRDRCSSTSPHPTTPSYR